MLTPFLILRGAGDHSQAEKGKIEAKLQKNPIAAIFLPAFNAKKFVFCMKITLHAGHSLNTPPRGAPQKKAGSSSCHPLFRRQSVQPTVSCISMFCAPADLPWSAP
jgi:hypothetical protein